MGIALCPFFDRSKMQSARRRLGLTQYQLADISGYPQPQISQWETGRHRPCHFAALVLAKALETSILDLVDVGGDLAQALETETGALVGVGL